MEASSSGNWVGRGEAVRQTDPVGDGLEVRLFGEVRVGRAAQVIGPGTQTARTVLAMLASPVSRVVTRERLIEAVWGDDPPRSAVNSLQAHVSRLRDVLEPDRVKEDASVIESVAGGYRLQLAPEATDVGRFRAAVRRSASAKDRREALRLVEGPPLAGCADTWPVQAERRALEEERLTGVEAWARAEIDEGSPAEAIGELERLVAEHPLREQLWTLLVLALHGSGRGSDALDAYQRARDVLVDAAAVEPGTELQAAHRVVLEATATPAAPVAPRPSVASIPAARVTLVGREREVDEVSELLERWRLVTVVGPGGVGKTELGTAVARSLAGRRFPGGGVFVDLTRARGAGEVLGAVASALGVRLVGEHTEFMAAIAEQCRSDRSLLLLDNCEHVLQEVGGLVDRLLDDVEALTVLATSRAPLGVGGERVVRLGPLATEAAVELFLQRAEARQPGADRAAPPDQLRELCERLDGLPLAIELAAARADHLSAAEILQSVEATIQPLRRLDARDRADRHRSLTATIRWSYELLDARLQTVLRHLSVFRGPFDRDQAAAVSGPLSRSQVDDVLGQLVGHSLLTVDQTASPSTYRLLETIAAFARTELDEHGETEGALRQHRDWYVAWARRTPAGETVLDLLEAYRLRRHHADLLGALAHADAQGDLQALADLAVFAGGLTFCPAGLPDAVRWLGRARQRAADGGLVDRSDLLGIGSIVGMLADDIETSLELAEQVVPLLDGRPDGAGPSAVALAMGFLEVADRFADVADRLLATHRETIRPDLRLEVEAMRPLATLYATSDHLEALEQAAAAWDGRSWSDRRTMATWTVHAALLHVCGEHAELRRRLHAMERVDERIGPPTFFAAVFDALAAAVDGDPDQAMAHLRRTREQHWYGIPGAASELIGTLAAVAALAGDKDRARDLLAVPGLRPRHPGTAIVHVWYRRQLGAPVADFMFGWWGRGLNETIIATLDDQLGS